MKNLFLTMFLSVMVISLVACGGAEEEENLSAANNESASNVELDYWVPFSGGDGEFMESMVQQFNDEHENVNVSMLNVEWDEYYTKLRTAMNSQSGPDVAISHASRLIELIPSGNVEPLDDLVEAAEVDWSEFSENQVNATIFDDQHYAIPLDAHALIMYYNKEYLEEAGLLNEDGEYELDGGMDQFIEDLRTINENVSDGEFPFVSNTNEVYPFWIWYTLNSQLGGTYIEDDQAVMNSQEGLEALTAMEDMVNEELWPKNVNNAYDLFRSGRAAFNFAGVWATGNYEQEEGLEFGASPIPQLFDDAKTWGDSHTLILPSQDDEEQKQAALMFADWLADHGAYWAQAGHVPSKPSILESEEYLELEYRPGYAEVLADVEYMPNHPSLGAVNDVMIQQFSQVLNSDMTPEEGLEAAETNAQNAIDQN
ncbi:ABC transporter substrate-binding protein [Salipaludibacillus keqinensis]|uniref:ABC transporter substrate-binding protein n=1 Tax=Salipaludibacillus keqinensis TaxID=2045207 RepID=A0A323TF57_9BACI|nr:ABC transporter substrate-binding protein [Salipaludibacillus keqinensis]PYZ92664.1 ABC transporter substrate-binding protein [Salipaludibacillus keqinensis]